MGVSSAVIKKTAKAALHGKYFRCMVAAAIPIFMTFVVIFASEMTFYARPLQKAYPIIFMVLFVFGLLPLYFGTLRFFWRAFSECEDEPVTVFYYFSNAEHYKRAIKLVKSIAVKLVGRFLLFFTPSIITGILGDSRIYELMGIKMFEFSSVFWILSGFFRIAGFILATNSLLKCFIAPFLLVADEDMEPEEAVHMSWVVSKGIVFDYIVLIFCFAHWILVSFLVIPAIFTVPYMIMSYLVHARFAVARYNRIQNQTVGNAIPTFVADI